MNSNSETKALSLKSPRLIIDKFLCGAFFSHQITPKILHSSKQTKHRCLPSGPLVMSGYPSRIWQHESQPQFWSKFQVWEWLQQVMDIHQIDASSIPLQNFDMDGHQLCSLSYQDFMRAAGSVGPILFHSITELKWSGTSVRLSEPCGASERDD